MRVRDSFCLGDQVALGNNAGIIRRAPFLEFSEQDWDEVMTVHSTAVFNLAQAAARGMVER